MEHPWGVPTKNVTECTFRQKARPVPEEGKGRLLHMSCTQVQVRHEFYKTVKQL
jgi:hypothetical protein